MGSSGGFTVLDLETTGFGSKSGDRVVEIGLVKLSRELEIQQTWTSLVNPSRELAGSGIHGIRAEWLESAPRFEEIAGHLARLLDGTVLVMHNASFDLRFLEMEFSRLEPNLSLDFGNPICTMRFAKHSIQGLSRTTLSSLVFQLGIEAHADHSAGGDAYSTAKLFQKLVEDFDQSRKYLAVAKKAHVPRNELTINGVAFPRPKKTEIRASFASKLVKQLPLRTGLSIGVHEYLDLLDEFLIDEDLDFEEMEKLLALAAEWGLGVEELEQAHLEYFEVLSRTFWEDGRLSPSERQALTTRARVLGIGDLALQKELQKSPHIQDLPFGLRHGDSVVLTGDMVPPKEVLGETLKPFGLAIKTSVSSKTNLVVAANVDSLSGKAQKARELGVPIVSAGQVYREFSDLASSGYNL